MISLHSRCAGRERRSLVRQNAVRRRNTEKRKSWPQVISLIFFTKKLEILRLKIQELLAQRKLLRNFLGSNSRNILDHEICFLPYFMVQNLTAVRS